jgi:MerR family transcriptional regulator, light-induced transcriptional regulator
MVYCARSMYNIKEAASRAGLTVPLLRAWERRYGVVKPQRSPTGYRLYSPDEIARVRAMQNMVGSGWSPSAAAGWLAGKTDAEIGAANPVDSPTTATETTATAVAPGPSWIERFIESAAAMDAAGMEDLLDEVAAIGSFELVAEGYLLPVLVAVGSAWESGAIDVAAEHSASNAILRRLAAAFAAAGRDLHAVSPVLVGLPPGSRHELGALAFSVAARRAGLPVLYMGADLPVEDWVGAASRTKAAAAVIGVISEGDRHAASSVVAALRDAGLDVVVALGGRAAHGLDTHADVVRLPEGLSAATTALRDALAPDMLSLESQRRV